MKNYVSTVAVKSEYSDLPAPLHAGDLSRALAFWGLPYILKHARQRAIYHRLKRLLDVSIAASILAAASPVVAVIAVMIKLTSPGPVIFRHKRLGKDGVPFECFKFRTMACDAEQRLREDEALRKQFAENFKIENDPRVTRIGGFLRKTSLDELPQLVQIIQGKMSLIGPRPIVNDEVEKYSIYADKLFSVTPGLSGLWQTSGRSDTTYNERIALDMYYVDNRSLRMEMKLMAMTMITVVKRSGAY